MLFRTLALLGVSACVCLAAPVPAGKPSHFPDWWFEREVIRLLPESSAKTSTLYPDDYFPADDYAVANIGQLKLIAQKAAEEFDSGLPPPGSGAAIQQLLSSWEDPSPPTGNRDDFAGLNEGQLKTVASVFYNRLAELGYAGPPLSGTAVYPWTDSTTDDDAYALVNLGQLKTAFSFDLDFVILLPGDDDYDGLPDAWEVLYFTSAALYGGIHDPEGDGISNRLEFLAGTSPLFRETNILGLEIYTP